MTPKASTRLYVTSDLAKGLACDLSQDQAHYLRSVLRLQVGAKVILFNGKDGEWLGEISELGKKSAQIELQEHIREQQSSPDVWLLFAPLKKSATDLVFQKACELGASSIRPVTTQHSNTERLKIERAHSIVIEASEQCERLDIPDVEPVTKLVDMLAQWPADRHLFVCA
ncbi:MAG: RsmE family RNA methyltransferase, partial [Alphaproteobacteria bacterium]|nr:RsmE family RNA methyltransferase [Alphaproteobacteria bacterium]